MSSTNPFILLSLISIFALSAISRANALKCYVCNDCEIYFNETHITDCELTGAKCIKMVEAKGAVSRDCGSKEICTRQITPQPTPADTKQSTISKPRPEKLLVNNDAAGPRKRSGQLLQVATTTTKKPEGPPPPEISSLHCCEEDECNGAFSQLSPNTLLHVFLNLVVPFCTLTFQYNFICIS